MRGKNPDGSWRTQQQWQDARNLRRDEKRMAYLSDRRKRGLDFGDQAYANLLAGQGYSGKAIEDPFQNAIDKHSIDFDPDARIQDTSFEQNLPENIKALNTYNDMIPGQETKFVNQDAPGPWNNFTPGGITNIDINEETIGNSYDDIKDHMAFTEGSILDQKLKNAFNSYNETGFGLDNVKTLMKMDIKNKEKKGKPLSLPASAYTLIS